MNKTINLVQDMSVGAIAQLTISHLVTVFFGICTPFAACGATISIALLLAGGTFGGITGTFIREFYAQAKQKRNQG
jgi:predicted membrane protein